MRWALIAMGLLGITRCDAQSAPTSRTLQFEPRFGDHALVLDAEQNMGNDAPVTVTQLRFYISRITAQFEGRTVWKGDGGVRLLDASDPSSLKLTLAIPTDQRIDGVTFLLGIDSLTNVSGAMGGDLDPTKGMYWSWNSGYINLKIEGTSPACTGVKNQFHYHLGGYLPPFQNAQGVSVAVKNDAVIPIRVDVAALLKEADLGSLPSIMSPSVEAVELARMATGMFSSVIDEK